MQKVRNSVFETNSSSTHSINIDKSGLRNSTLAISDGVCRIFGGEFGWEVENYCDASSKAAYCYTYAAGNYGGKGKPELLEMLKEAIEEHTGAKVEFMESEHVYIDHQSDYICAPAFADKETLKQFIFCSGSQLHTDNDNHD